MALVPKNWKEFQHYRDRKPAWIKLHGAILDDFEYFRLPVASKALAPLLWLLAREYEGGEITASLEEVAFRMRMPVPELVEALRPLLAAKFFFYDKDMPECFQSDSGPLAPRKQDAMPEKEGETERETERHSPSTVAAATAAEARADLDDDGSPVIAKAVAGVLAGKLFADFWSAYPKRDGANPKEPARKKFLAAVKSGDDADAIIAGARGYAEELRRTNKLNTSYVAQAVTWLNQRRWTDYEAQPERQIAVDPDPGFKIDPTWAPARARLLADLGPEVFSSWFRNVCFLSIVDGNRVRMTAPSRFMKSQIEKDYMPRLLRAWQASMPDVEFVEIIVAADGKRPPGPLAA
ncbi:DnaA N-terminal domain-containing protein [Bradyrhizobium sp. SZCCHNRI3042]|uniref:DnaA N-terminal domain-containing protein n=1 Tax=Bradyrhizobium sp. SZCCHNRI3042 TaxID=3057291 RepID=UPI002916C2A1|nr:DnaA N-terminal domain-containing protein [Bradyrhizobium sp. SZCCHNRI3042]